MNGGRNEHFKHSPLACTHTAQVRPYGRTDAFRLLMNQCINFHRGFCDGKQKEGKKKGPTLSLSQILSVCQSLNVSSVLLTGRLKEKACSSVAKPCKKERNKGRNTVSMQRNRPTRPAATHSRNHTHHTSIHPFRTWLLTHFFTRDEACVYSPLDRKTKITKACKQ
mmetsp:Transcript_27055/g.53084  ORF Transcript_27055/g.53084 Transcript_27055/m.53084 type:complete len:166 (-) Transcript_27055:1961-2458(-)